MKKIHTIIDFSINCNSFDIQLLQDEQLKPIDLRHIIKCNITSYFDICKGDIFELLSSQGDRYKSAFNFLVPCILSNSIFDIFIVNVANTYCSHNLIF